MKTFFISAVYANALDLSKQKVRSTATADELLGVLRRQDMVAAGMLASAFHEVFNVKAKLLDAGFKGGVYALPKCCADLPRPIDNSDGRSIVAKEVAGFFGTPCKGVEVASTADGCIFLWPSNDACKEDNILIEMARELGYSKGIDEMLASPLWC